MNPRFPEAQQVTDIYVINPFATNGNGFTPPEGATVLYTEADREANIKNLGALLTGEAAYRVRVAAGDGTVAWAMEASVQSGQEVDISVKKGGYKNDMAAMVAEAGGRIAVSPLVLERRQEHDDADPTWELERMIAYSYGLGAIAVGAKMANSKEEFRTEKAALIERIRNFRDKLAAFGVPKRLVNPEFWGSKITDAKLALGMLRSEVEIEGRRYPTHVTMDGRKLGAFIASNGNMMSGGWMGFMFQKLHQEGFVTSTVGRSIPGRMMGMSARMVRLHPFKDRWVRGATLPFEVNETTLAQADGEDFIQARGTYRIREFGKTLVTLSVEAEANGPDPS
ncbi:MAG TPA: hypothetical protein VL737_02300 [Candidatus Pristimantibacillus sp.]|jgi:hypothetical protein|nr:hypothetical protein [Candidatus Pristimantibacillus sp.]